MSFPLDLRKQRRNQESNENAHCAERKNLKEESNIHSLEPEPTGIISNCAHSLLVALPETASVEFPLVLSMAQDLGYAAQVMAVMMDVYDVDGSLNFIKKGYIIIDRMEVMQMHH